MFKLIVLMLVLYTLLYNREYSRVHFQTNLFTLLTKACIVLIRNSVA